MNILIYIPYLDQSSGGVRQYSVGLINNLSGDKTHTYFIYHNNQDPEIEYLFKANSQFIRITDNDVAETERDKLIQKKNRVVNFIYRRLKIQKQFLKASLIDKLCAKYKIEIIHCPYQFIPDTNKAKLITTLHDVQELHYPEFFSAEDRAWRAANYVNHLRRATKVVVSYDHIKEDLITYFNVPSEKIDVILLEMGKLWFQKFSQSDVVSLSSLNIPEPFVLYPANTWKHKNHIRLLEAVALLKKKYNIYVTVVCSGHLNEYYEREIKNVLSTLQLQEQVKFVGVVSEQLLYSLYKKALGVIVPTLYEAGSFPLMESILLSVPVICSNVTSLPQTMQNEEFLFNPIQIEEMAEKLKELWTSEAFRERSLENSKRVKSHLITTHAFKKLMNLYDECFHC